MFTNKCNHPTKWPQKCDVDFSSSKKLFAATLENFLVKSVHFHNFLLNIALCFDNSCCIKPMFILYCGPFGLHNSWRTNFRQLICGFDDSFFRIVAYNFRNKISNFKRSDRTPKPQNWQISKHWIENGTIEVDRSLDNQPNHNCLWSCCPKVYAKITWIYSSMLPKSNPCHDNDSSSLFVGRKFIDHFQIRYPRMGISGCYMHLGRFFANFQIQGIPK